MAQTVWLQRPNSDVPWGFRLAGGRDYQEPLRVQRVTVGSIAATGLSTGDVITRIGDIDTNSLTFGQSQEVVKNAGNLLQLSIVKSGGDRPVGSPSSPATAAPQPLYHRQQSQPQQQQQRQQQQQQPQQQQQFPTKLEQQLAGMKMNNYSPAPYSYSPQGGSSSSPQAAPSYGGGQGSAPSSPEKAVPSSPQRMPDAILNMAAKGEPDKKPWSYAPDVNVLQEQREKVRRRAPGSSIPRYQKQLNLPNFDDSPTPPTAPSEPTEEGGYAQHMQYNSPLHVYSAENVEDAFKGQSGGTVTAVQGLPNKNPQDITQSPVYRMIHGMDSDKPRPRPVNVEDGDDQGDVGNYDEASIRYRGKHIPSKSFRRLQNMTGGPDSQMLAPPPGARKPKQQQAEEPEQNPDDIVDIRFVGGNIPSRSFRMLQQMTGGDKPEEQEKHQMNGDVDPDARRDLQPAYQQPAAVKSSPQQSAEEMRPRDLHLQQQQQEQDLAPGTPTEESPKKDATSVAAERRRMRRRQLSTGNDNMAERPETPTTPTTPGSQPRLRMRPRTREEARRQRAATPESPKPALNGPYFDPKSSDLPSRAEPQKLSQPANMQPGPVIDLTKIPSSPSKADSPSVSPRFARSLQRTAPAPCVDLTKISSTPEKMHSPSPRREVTRDLRLSKTPPPVAQKPDRQQASPVRTPEIHLRDLPAAGQSWRATPKAHTTSVPTPKMAPSTAPVTTRQAAAPPTWPTDYQPRPQTPPIGLHHQHQAPVPHSPVPSDVRVTSQSPRPHDSHGKPRRRKAKPEEPPPEPFDELAYLRGRVPLVTGDPATRMQARPPLPTELIPMPDQEEQPVRTDFDEQAFLQGKVSIFGGPTKPHPPKEKEEEEPEWTKHRKPALQDLPEGDQASQFDDSAFLRRQPKEQSEAEAEWTRHRKPALQDLPDGEAANQFDEQSFLRKQPKDMTPEEHAEWTQRRKPALQDLPEGDKAHQFDENAFLGRQPGKGQIQENKAVWTQRRKPALQDLPDGADTANQFDEDAFLGRQPVAVEIEEDGPTDASLEARAGMVLVPHKARTTVGWHENE